MAPKWLDEGVATDNGHFLWNFLQKINRIELVGISCFRVINNAGLHLIYQQSQRDYDALNSMSWNIWLIEIQIVTREFRQFVSDGIFFETVQVFNPSVIVFLDIHSWF